MNFYGEYVRVMEKKWRVMLPAEFKLKGKNIYFYLTHESLVEIYSSLPTASLDKEEYRYVYEKKVDYQGRVLIPKEIRDKTFFRPCKIRFIGCKDYIRLQLEEFITPA